MKKLPGFKDCFAELIALPSASSIDPAHDQSNRAVIETLAAYLEDLGFACEVSVINASPDKLNLVAQRGDGAPGLVLSGHTDTVPCHAADWQSDPFTLTERDGNYYGLGSADMKCFFPIVLEVLKGLHDTPLKRPVTVLATADEESTMAGARAIQASGRALGRYCLIGEPTGLIPQCLHKGILVETVALAGQSGHSSNPALADSALEGMNDVINALRDWRGDLQARYRDEAFEVPVPTLNLGRIQGGDSANRICAHCDLSLDLRLLPGMDVDALRRELRQVVQAAISGSDLTVTYHEGFDGVPPMQTPKESAIVTLSEQLTGESAGAVAFATEGAYFNGMGLETVILGPGDIEVAHQADEYVPINRIEPMMKIVSDMLIHFCGAD